MLSSQGLVFATAMAVSAGTIILFDILREKYSHTPKLSQNQDSSPQKQRIFKPCLSSGEKNKESKKKKKKKVQFAEGVKDSVRNGEEYRRHFQRINQSRSCGNESMRLKGMPANRAALYTGLLKDRMHRIQYSY